MHGIKLPFTGLIISGLAVTCIILIARHVPSKTAIIKATIIVAIFKLMLSPQSPLPAYFAVFFQGMTGQLLFLSKRFFKLSSIMLAVLSLVESAIQRILVLLILYGSGFWKAVDQYIQKLTGEKTVTNYSLMIAGVYILVHGLIGIFIGIYASILAKKSLTWRSEYPEYIIDIKEEKVFEPRQRKKKKRIKLIFIFIWLVLLAFLLQAYFDPKNALLPLNEVTAVILRSVIIVLGWYLFVAPLAMILIKKILANQQAKKRKEINEVMELLPQTKYIFITSWQLSGEEKGFSRLKLFLKILLINILSEEKA